MRPVDDLAEVVGFRRLASVNESVRETVGR
jgi:hypothetical protein